MHLSSLLTTPSLTAEYDAQGHCLFIQLHNRTALTGVFTEAAWAGPALATELPSCCLVQDSLPESGATADRLPWLTDQLLPKLYQAGIQQWLWVRQPTASSYRLLEQVRQQLPKLIITTFCDVEQASAWLQNMHPLARPSRPVATKALRPMHWTAAYTDSIFAGTAA